MGWKQYYLLKAPIYRRRMLRYGLNGPISTQTGQCLIGSWYCGLMNPFLSFLNRKGDKIFVVEIVKASHHTVWRRKSSTVEVSCKFEFFTADGAGPLVSINGIMDKKIYKISWWNTLSRPCSSSGREFSSKTTIRNILQSRSIKNYLNSSYWLLTLIWWPSQSTDLNPFENIWVILN